MTEIKVGENESLDNALKRFKRSCARSGVIGEVRKREHYEKPSVRKKKKVLIEKVNICHSKIN
jgi:small subunit ribosomal protein S21